MENGVTKNKTSEASKGNQIKSERVWSCSSSYAPLDLGHVLLEHPSVTELPSEVGPHHCLDELGDAGKLKGGRGILLPPRGRPDKQRIGRARRLSLDQRKGDGLPGPERAGVAGEDRVERRGSGGGGGAAAFGAGWHGFGGPSACNG